MTAPSYDENASPESLPGYNLNQELPGAQFNQIDPGTTFNQPDAGTTVNEGVPGAVVGPTEMDPTQVNAGVTANANMASAMRDSLRASLSQLNQQTQSATQTDPVTAGSPLSAQQQAPALNYATPTVMNGYIASTLTYTDDSLIAAVQAAAASSGPQAGLMAKTVKLTDDTVAAGGGAPVGHRGTPAAALIYGSQGGGNTAKQFADNVRWFFPAVNTWADAHPPPQPKAAGPQDGSLPMDSPPQ